MSEHILVERLNPASIKRQIAIRRAEIVELREVLRLAEIRRVLDELGGSDE